MYECAFGECLALCLFVCYGTCTHTHTITTVLSENFAIFPIKQPHSIFFGPTLGPLRIPDRYLSKDLLNAFVIASRRIFPIDAKRKLLFFLLLLLLTHSVFFIEFVFVFGIGHCGIATAQNAKNQTICLPHRSIRFDSIS